LTLPVSTATTERSFSAMKIIKNKLRNKMKAGFLADSMSVYIEREIAATINSDTIIDEFKALATRNASF
jgi:ribosomal protein L31E